MASAIASLPVIPAILPFGMTDPLALELGLLDHRDRLDLLRALLGADAAALAVRQVETLVLAVLEDHRGVRTVDPADQAVRALLRVEHGTERAPPPRDVSVGRPPAGDDAADRQLLPALLVAHG